MNHTYNITGPKDKIDQLLTKYDLETVDEFKPRPGCRDVNVRLSDMRADPVSFWCENHDLKFEMV